MNVTFTTTLNEKTANIIRNARNKSLVIREALLHYNECEHGLKKEPHVMQCPSSMLLRRKREFGIDVNGDQINSNRD